MQGQRIERAAGLAIFDGHRERVLVLQARLIEDADRSARGENLQPDVLRRFRQRVIEMELLGLHRSALLDLDVGPLAAQVKNDDAVHFSLPDELRPVLSA